jgi:GH24 family phage-related lysozyme (muramidase)
MQFELVPVAKEKEPLGLWDSMKLGTRKAGVGTIQLGLDVASELGYDFPETKAAAQKVAGQLKEQGTGSGVTGAIGEMLGNPLTLPLAAAGVPAGLMKMAGVGALEGAAYGATEALPEGESRGKHAVMSAAIGGIAAPASSIVLKGVGRGADVALNKVSDAYAAGKALVNSFLSQADDATRNTMAIEISGITSPKDAIKAIDSMGDDAVKYVKNAIKSGLSPQEAYIAGKAQSKGINLTRGQVSQNPMIQRLEDMAQQGVLGDDAYKIASDAAAKQQGALRSFADDITSRATNAPAGSLPLDNTSIGGTIKSEILPLAKSLKGAANQAYSVDTAAKVDIGNLADISKAVRRDLVSRGFDVGAMPTLSKRLGEMNRAADLLSKRSGTVKYQAAEVFKKRLYKSYQDAKGSEKAALGKLHSAYAERLDKIIDEDLLINPDEAAKTLRQAPALWRKYRQTIYGTDGKAALGKIVDKDLSDKQVSDLLGSGLFGKGETQKVVSHLKAALGDESDSINQVRGLYLNRIMNNALQDPKRPLSEAIHSNLTKFKRENKALYEELYSPALRRDIEDFAAIAWQAGNKVKSKVNPSGSGVYLSGFANSLLRRLPGFGDLSVEILRQLNQGGMESRAIQAITEPLKQVGADTRIISNALRSTGFTAGAQAGRVLQTPAAPTSEPVSNVQFELVPITSEPLPTQQPLPPQSALPDDLTAHEGLRFSAYDDTEGYRTVGRGFNMQSGIARRVWKNAGVTADFDAVMDGAAAISQQEADALAAESLRIATDDASKYVANFSELSEPRKAAIINLSYQLGYPRLAKFDTVKKHIESGKFALAARELTASKWFQQTGKERRNWVLHQLVRG